MCALCGLKHHCFQRLRRLTCGKYNILLLGASVFTSSFSVVVSCCELIIAIVQYPRSTVAICSDQ